MTQVLTMLTGNYPRSEALVQATRDHDRGRIDDPTLRQHFQVDLKALFTLQTAAQIDVFTDGLLNWQDDFRPLVEATEGLHTGPLVRYFNTNTFYRQPVFQPGNPELNVEILAPYFLGLESQQPWKATLPSLGVLAQLSSGRENRWDVAVKLLGQVIRWLASRGCSLVELQEPWFAYHSAKLESSQREQFTTAMERLLQDSGDLPIAVGLHLPFGDSAPLIAPLWDLPLHFLGVDFYQTDLDTLRRFDWSERTLLAGCVNGRNSLLEDEKTVVEFVEQVLEELQPRGLYLGNNVHLRFLPEAIARRKVELLGSVKRRFTRN